MSEANIRLKLTEKKVEAAVEEGERKAEAERVEIKRLKDVLEQKEALVCVNVP